MSQADPVSQPLRDAALVVFILVGLIWWARVPFQPPEPVGAEAPDTVISAERAREHLQVIAAGPHEPGTDAHREVREYLVGELTSLGLEVEVQSTTSVRRWGARARAVAVHNVLGRLRGTASTGSVLLMAHYDPVPHSPGANDDGTGVSAILEAVRVLRGGPPLQNDIIVLLSDGEELGLMGARAFVERHRWYSDVALVVNMEMRGHGASLMFETGPENGWIVREWGRADPHPVGNSMSLAVYRSMPNDTDFSPFRDRGVQGLNFAAIGGGNLYHRALDNLDHDSPAALQHQGDQALAMARHFGGLDLTETHAPDVAFTRMALMGLLVFSPTWNWVGLILALVLAAASLAVGMKRGAMSAKGVGAGFGLAVLSALVAAGLAWLIFRGAQGFHPEYRRLVGSSFHREGWYFLAVMVLSLSLLLRFMGWGRRRFRVSELAWGASLLPLAVAAALVPTAPLAAMNLVGPVLFGELALLLFILRIEDESQVGWRKVGTLFGLGLLLSPVVFLMVPLTEVLWMAMSISLAPVLAVLGSLIAILLLPLLTPLQSPNRWWALVTLEALVLFSFLFGLSRAAPGPENPTPTSLFYVMDRDLGSAWWATSDRSGEPWIRARVPETEVREPEGRFFPRGYATAEADPVQVPVPAVTVLRDTTESRGRVVRLAIASGFGAELLELRTPEEVEVTLLGVGDWRDGEGEPGPLILEHWGDPGGPVEVELAVSPEADELELLLRETTFRPERLLGAEAFSRPDHLISSGGLSSDVATLGTTIRVLLGDGDAGTSTGPSTGAG